MDMAGVKAGDIDLIILATITPDTHCPAGANWLEAKLGCDNAVSFDITAACTGFIFALHLADKLIRSGANKKALVVAGEIMSRVVNWKERESCILWGDGAGAAVVTESGRAPKSCQPISIRMGQAVIPSLCPAEVLKRRPFLMKALIKVCTS